MKQLLDAYVWATEVNLATLSELAELKSTAKYRLARQKRICLMMLKVCQEYAGVIEWHGQRDNLVGRKGACKRVKDMLTVESLGGLTLDESLDRFIAYCKG